MQLDGRWFGVVERAEWYLGWRVYMCMWLLFASIADSLCYSYDKMIPLRSFAQHHLRPTLAERPVTTNPKCSKINDYIRS